MIKKLQRVGMAVALTATAMTAANTAEARDRYYRNHRGDAAGAAIAGGVIGLALGAAAASSRRGDYYYNDGYYGRPGGYYGYPRSYYYRSYPHHYYYDRYPRHRYYGGYGWNNGGRGHYRGW